MWNRTSVTQVSREEAIGDKGIQRCRQLGCSGNLVSAGLKYGRINNVHTNNRDMACITHAGSKCSRLRDPHHRKMQTPYDSSRTSERTVSIVQTGEPAILKDQPSQPTHCRHRLLYVRRCWSIYDRETVEQNVWEERCQGWSQEEVRQWRDRPESVAATG
jgi:hypothetical protein